MSQRDHLLFNCSEPYELEYVADLFVEKEQVHTQLKAWCQDNYLHDTNHSKLYEMLISAGYHRRPTVIEQDPAPLAGGE